MHDKRLIHTRFYRFNRTQALEVCDNLNIKVVSLVANSNVRVIEEQIRRFKPEVAALYNEKAARELRLAVKDTDTRILEGSDGVLEAVTYSQADTVLTSVVGTAGLYPQFQLLRQEYCPFK